MSTGAGAFGCEQVREVAPELALGVLGGAERAEALIHLGGCARCQAYVAELTEAGDALALVVPEREPPPGFEHRVLEALDAGRHRSRRRVIALVAAVAAAVAILSITAVRVIDARRDDGATPSALVQARMVSDSTGAPAGWAYVSGGRSVTLSVDYGLEAGNYAISVRPSRGDPVVIGDMEVTGNRGMWSGTSQVDIGSGSRISLVDHEGSTVCEGRVESTDQ
jgi:hypothetical protein